MKTRQLRCSLQYQRRRMRQLGELEPPLLAYLTNNYWCFSNFLRCLSNQDSIIYARDNIDREDKEEIVKRIGEIADGVFQFSDIHEHGGKKAEELRLILLSSICIWKSDTLTPNIHLFRYYQWMPCNILFCMVSICIIYSLFLVIS